MSKFLKITNFLLNTSKIHRIDIHPNKYTIHLVPNKISGGGLFLFSSGSTSINTVSHTIDVCKIEHSTDYEIVSKFIDKFSN